MVMRESFSGLMRDRKGPSCRRFTPPLGSVGRLSEVSGLEQSELTGLLFNEECDVLFQARLEELVPLPHP